MVHSIEEFKAHCDNIETIRQKKQEVEEIQKTINCVDAASEWLDAHVMPTADEQTKSSIEEYYKIQNKALLGKKIQLEYEINELERKLIDFEARALMAD